MTTEHETATTGRTESEKAATSNELGAVALKTSGGIIQEEFLTVLQGERGRRAYTEMSLNDAALAGLLFAIEMPIREVEWTVEPGGDKAVDREAAEFVQQCMDDMSLSWTDLITQVLSMLTYGWSFFEKVFKQRKGLGADPSSLYDDNRIGWRKLAFRSQDSLARWLFDDKGGTEAMVQGGWPMKEEATIPMKKAVLFRTRADKGNPEGRSILRTAYRAWWYKNNLERIEAIALERTGAGYPVVYLPRGASTTDRTKAEGLVRRIRTDEQMGIVLQGPKGDSDNGGWEFGFLSPPSARGVGEGFHVAILRYRAEMLMSSLAAFLQLGTGEVGSWALSRDQRGLFQVAIEGWVSNIEDTFNRFAVPDLIQLNGFRVSEMPKLAHSDIGQVSLEEMSRMVGALAPNALINYDRELENFFRTTIGAPLIPEGEEEGWPPAQEPEAAKPDVDERAAREAEGVAKWLENTGEIDKARQVRVIAGRMLKAAKDGYVRQADGYVQELYEGAHASRNGDEDGS